MGVVDGGDGAVGYGGERGVRVVGVVWGGVVWCGVVMAPKF